MDTFGSRLEMAIETSRYKSNAQLARDIGISPVTLSHIITGKSDTTVSKVRLMTRFLNSMGASVTYDWLIDGEESPMIKELHEKYTRAKKSIQKLAKHSSNGISSQQQKLPFFNQKVA